MNASWRLLPLSLLLASSFTLANDNKAPEGVPLNELRTFTEVFHQIRSHYVQEVSDKQLLQYAIEGMLSGLDPHSAWLSKADFQSIQESTQGEFGGVGIEISQENAMLRVIAPMDDTPAQRAGIKAGDMIIRIDDKNLKGLSMDESIELMRGPKGSTVTLTIVREEEKKPLEFKLKRDVIKIQSVKSRLINQQYAYLRIAQFQTNSASDALKHLNDLRASIKEPLKGIILDLRNNPGGVLNGAIELSDIFLKEGLIVYTEGRSADSREQFMASGKAAFSDLPMVVLINSGSASASEIVAGALQDHRRALIVGTQSFGKGSVQTIVPVNEDKAVKLTTALYYTPLGRSIQAEGITPDIIAADGTVTTSKRTLEISEANLARHIDNKKPSKKADAAPTTDANADMHKDYPLHEAVNLLKALQFNQGR